MNNSNYNNVKCDPGLELDSQDTAIGLYEMLAQAQPDVTNTHSSLVDFISQKLQISNRSHE